MTQQSSVSEAHDDRREGLLAWQWALYRQGHADRRSLLLHAVSAPLFWVGSMASAVGLFGYWRFLAVGGGLVLVVVALQGRAHRLEAARPVPFRSPLDFVARFFVEQWITFPRYVLSGEFRRALREDRRHAQSV